MVPPATFTSYYGRPVVKASPWQADIPAYLFLGGLAAGSALLAAGADVTHRNELRRVARVGAFIGAPRALSRSIHDLGKPSRFLNMMRVAKPTSPMSMGTWVLAAFVPAAGVAGAAELIELLPRRPPVLGAAPQVGVRPAGLLAAASGARPRVVHRSPARRTPQLPHGTRAVASCRSFSPGLLRPLQAGSECWGRPWPRQSRHGEWRWAVR